MEQLLERSDIGWINNFTSKVTLTLASSGMADPDADSDEEFDDSPDYYSVLNVRKEVR